MKAKKINHKIIVRIDKDEEIIESLLRVCKEYDVRAGSVNGIGATNKLTIGLFDVDSKNYHSKELSGNYEIAPLIGNISWMNDEPYLHVHINVCDDHHHSFGGHLNKAIVSATCECIIDCMDGELHRDFDEEIGLNLLSI